MRSDDLARIHAFERESIALVAESVEPIAEGWVARTETLPVVWSANHVGVDRPIHADDAIALVEQHMRDLPFRHLIVEDQSTGERLEGELRGAGWKIDCNIAMALAREPDRRLDTSAVIELSEADALELMARWTSEDEHLRRSPEAHRQVVESSRLTWRARRARRLGVLGRDGAPAGITLLFSDGIGVAQVEDVYVAPEERGRGLGRALVTRAVALAVDTGHEFVFIVGDDNDWPKHLYASVGFEAAGRSWVFHR